MGRYAIFNGLVYGGGTDVIPNPEGTPTDELHSIQIGDDIYEIVGGGGSGEGYSETLLYKYENGTTIDGIKTLNDDITNYDLLLFRLVFNVPTYTDHIISVSALEQVGYIPSPVATGPHVSIVSYASDYIRIVEGETKNKINIFEINGNEYIDEIYGIKIEGGSSSGGGNASLDATTLYDTPITSTGTYTLADDYNNYDFIGFKAGNGSTETDIRLYAVKDIQDSMNDNLVITNNVTNSWFNFTINENELTIPGKTVSTIYSVIGYKIKGGGSSTNVQRLSPEAYSALPQSEKENGTIYFVHKDAGETTISGSFTTGSTQYEKVIVDCGFKPTSISVVLPFSNGDTYAEYDEVISTTTSTWEIPMESRTYTITLGSETGESGITDILDNGFKFRCNASNTRNVNCTFEATGVLDNEINKIYYMGNEYTNGGSGGDGGQELVSYDTTITTTQYGWWTAEDKDGNVLDPDKYELIAVTPIVNNSPSWTGAWDGAFFINTVDGVTYRYDVSFVNINDGGYIRTSRTWDVKVVYRDKNAAGGGDGSTVVPNPQEEPTDTLNTIEIDGVVYDIEGGSEGEGVEIYSEDEYIVGKWIDGKKLYQKTYHLAQAITVTGGGTWTDTGVDISDIETLVDSKFSQDIAVWDAINGINDNGVLKATILASGSLTVDTITLRYTKTVETPAPAWGGSVTNNYANFIDTNNVIDSGVYNPTTPLSYTATKDCFMVIVLIASNNPCIVSVDNKEIYRLYDNGVSSITVPVPIKKGQTITATTSYSSEDSPYTVYGISYASGGSEGGSKIEYSTEEKEVGTWIDGSPIYQKTFVLSSPIALTSGDWTVISEVNIPNADASIYTEVFYSSTKTQLTAAGRFDNGVLSIFLPFTFRTDKVTVRYTKTTT